MKLNRKIIVGAGYTVVVAMLLLGIVLYAIAQAPQFRPASGVPGVVEELRITTLELARQLHSQIGAQIVSETASPATYVYTTDGWIEESIWLAEAQTALDYWAGRITILEGL